MNRDHRLLFGPLAAVILLLGIPGLALLVPAYDPVRQTVSEIGEVGSPARIPFAAMLSAVAVCTLMFALALRRVAKEARRSPVGAWLTAFMAICVAGVGLFAFPHPLHNVFGIAELIGYQAPLVLALTWRGEPRLRTAVAICGVMALVVWIALALNLTSLARSGAIWDAVGPIYGLVQRALFAAWFGWCAVLGVELWRREHP